MNYKVDDYLKATLENFQKLRQDGNYCDVDLISENTVLKAHRVVLAAGCQYFKAMFDAGLNECQTGRVNLSSIPCNLLELIVNFIYTGEIFISSSNAQSLISAAQFLQLDLLVKGCSEYLKTQLHPSNAIGIFRYAEAHNCKDLARVAWDYIQVHLSSVAEMEEFPCMPLQMLTELLSSNQLLTEGEDEVLHAALRWLQHDLLSRREHCVEVLQRVRIHQMEPQILIDAMMNVQDPRIKEVVNMLLMRTENELPETALSSRGRPRNLYVVGGLCSDVYGNKTVATVLRYDAENRRWDTLAPMHTPRTSHGVVALGGRLYAVGGSNDLETLSSGEVYDLVIGEWSHIAPMSKARKCFGIAAVNRRIYVFGGLVDGQMDSSIEAYDPVSNVWCPMGEMPELRWGMSAVTHDGAVYLVGGRARNNRRTRTLLRYQPEPDAEGTWCRHRSISQGRDYAAVTVFKSRLYVIGGGADSIERYNFATGKWECVSAMEDPREGCVAGAVGDELLLGGGYSKSNYYSAVFMFNEKTNRWNDGPSMPQRWAYAGTALL